MTARAPDTPDGWEPGRDEARRLVQEELAGPEYAEAAPNPILQWLRDGLAALGDWLGSLAGPATAWPGWVLLAVLVAVAVVVLLLVRPRTQAASRTRRRAPVLPDRAVTADDHRRRAQAAADAGDHAEALAAWFRALVRAAEERTVLDSRPGRTATEAAQALGAAHPAEAAPLRTAAALFNAVVYGDRPVTAAQAAAVRDLEARLPSVVPGAPAPADRQDAGTVVAPR